MLLEFQVAGHDAAPVAVHGEVEGGIVIVDSGDEAVDADLGVKFLHYLAPERLFHGLAGLGLASRHLPPVLVFAVTPLGGEDLAFGIADDRCYYRDCFHERKDAVTDRCEELF